MEFRWKAYWADKLSNFLNENKIDLVVVGPEQPLVNGVVDYLEKFNIKVFGPNKIASQLEGSKIFTKKLCEEYNIPTAKFGILKNKIDARLATHIKTEHEVKTWINEEDETKISELLLDEVPPIINSLKALTKLRDYVIFTFYKNLSTRTELADSKFYYDDEVDIALLCALKKKERRLPSVLISIPFSKAAFT